MPFNMYIVLGTQMSLDNEVKSLISYKFCQIIKMDDIKFQHWIPTIGISETKFLHNLVYLNNEHQ